MEPTAPRSGHAIVVEPRRDPVVGPTHRTQASHPAHDLGVHLGDGADLHSPGFRLSKAGLRALGDDVAFPLGYGYQDVRHEATCWLGHVDANVEGDQSPRLRLAASRSCGALEDLPEVNDRARQPIQLRHDQRLSLTGIEHREGASKTGPSSVLSGLALVDDPLNGPSSTLGLSFDGFALRSDAVVLVKRAHAKIPDDLHTTHLPRVKSGPGRMAHMDPFILIPIASALVGTLTGFIGRERSKRQANEATAVTSPLEDKLQRVLDLSNELNALNTEVKAEFDLQLAATQRAKREAEHAIALAALTKEQQEAAAALVRSQVGQAFDENKKGDRLFQIVVAVVAFLAGAVMSWVLQASGG